MFTVTEGVAALSTPNPSGADGTVSVDVVPIILPGKLEITAAVAGLLPVIFTLTATPPASPPPAPRISAGGLVGGGLSTPAVKQISPNGIISIFGENFVPAGTQPLLGSADLVNGPLPTNLGGICVQVGSQLAPIFHVFPGKIVAIDVETGAFELADDTLTALERLLSRFPNAQIWCIRVGHRGVHRFGLRPASAGVA